MKRFIAIIIGLLLILVRLVAGAQTNLFIPTPRALTWNWVSSQFTADAVFTVYSTNALAPVSTNWPVFTNFPATSNLVGTNGVNLVYQVPVQLTFPASFFTVSVSNQSGIAWCVNPPFLLTDPLLQPGDLFGAAIK